jgi:uncharacterized protein (TIGR02246 family)
MRPSTRTNRGHNLRIGPEEAFKELDMGAQRATIDARSAIGAAREAFMEACRRNDAHGISALYTMDGRLLPQGSDVVNGRAAIERFWANATSKGTRTLETAKLKVQRDSAYEVGRYRVVGRDDEELDTGKYVMIWKLEDGSWLIHRDIWSTSGSAV